MPTQKDSLIDRLARFKELKITVTGRTSGRAISIPVWFVWEAPKLYLLPVQGSDTQWYKNVLKNPAMQIDARGAKADIQISPVTGAAQVSAIVEKFRGKYGAADVKKYYSKLDVAVVAEIR
jgi:deazaflavin-dependent oxidoreductase (nitroreductase family)